MLFIAYNVNLKMVNFVQCFIFHTLEISLASSRHCHSVLEVILKVTPSNFLQIVTSSLTSG